ncbi:uncharacterized protein LACBIDRAFT_313591 [Laccaria bicolor S238N-H82]|uniref:Mitochondrial import inner membrane translocase subunit TIM16 n=1 Tax=Laccaria bicolor (strain S238N-H82 / ATCC MYA-4686) TaxID=486041 RepID=B0D0C3_LACBS|nr:uncharacterized protein LACBIDRAFT_313591 [Laccaria bicolor S238N-H82]EDR11805.1 predicted protein [Laccaria bicolor S238N-H82]|eukprot:XP_001877702.1 predicted protein [Laccaria bicolor S238N-H82]
MASPRVIVQIFISGSRAVGKAFLEAGRQAVKNAKTSPQGVLGNDVAGVGNANSGSATDHLTRQHRMTLDEAHLILNVKRETPMEQIMKNYEHLYKSNAPHPKPDKPVPKKQALPSHSHYLQSKVVRARERIEAQLKTTEAQSEAELAGGVKNEASTSPPPPESQ